MSSIKFNVGEPKKITLSFDKPKEGTNEHGDWYMYGFKNGELARDEDCFFATETLHTMIQTLGAKEGDEVNIEKCQDGDISFFKVNGLTIKDMNSGGASERIEEAKPKEDSELVALREENVKLKAELEELKPNKLTDNDIPF